MTIGLQQNPRDMAFKFRHADIIDRAPIRGGSVVLNVHSVHHAQAVDHVTCTVSRAQIPKPQHGIVPSLDTELMFTRYKAYRQGKGPLLAMAYFCLRVFEASAGTRRDASIKYKVSKKVLDKFGALCSEKGTPKGARKSPKIGEFIPLSGAEKEWIDKVVKALIFRTGQCAFDPSEDFPQLTIDEFPRT
jgi:hypothetical protein